MAAQWVIEIFGGLLAILANVGFQGLFVVGAFLEQPYGNKICHSRVSTFCRIPVKDARKTLAAGSPRNDALPLDETNTAAAALHAEVRSASGFDPSPSLGIRALEELAETCRTSAEASSP